MTTDNRRKKIIMKLFQTVNKRLFKQFKTADILTTNHTKKHNPLMQA